MEHCPEFRIQNLNYKSVEVGQIGARGWKNWGLGKDFTETLVLVLGLKEQQDLRQGGYLR